MARGLRVSPTIMPWSGAGQGCPTAFLALSAQRNNARWNQSTRVSVRTEGIPVRSVARVAFVSTREPVARSRACPHLRRLLRQVGIDSLDATEDPRARSRECRTARRPAPLGCGRACAQTCRALHALDDRWRHDHTGHDVRHELGVARGDEWQIPATIIDHTLRRRISSSPRPTRTCSRTLTLTRRNVGVASG
jgi:hypothetical protein